MSGHRGYRLAVLGTFVLGVLAAVLATAGAGPADRTLVAAVTPAQSVMSILTPLIGILLVRDLRRSGNVRVLPPLLTGVVTAAALGTAVFLVSLGLVAVLPSTAGPARWSDLGMLALGSALVQCLALLSGTGLGLLIRSPVLAFVATLVVPLGLWRLFGSAEVLLPLRGWLTQYESARRLLSGTMSPLAWVQFLVVVLIWGVGLNALGARRRDIRHPTSSR